MENESQHSSRDGGHVPRMGQSELDLLDPMGLFGTNTNYFLFVTVILLIFAKLFCDNFHNIVIIRKKYNPEDTTVPGLEAIPGPTPIPLWLIGNIYELWPISGKLIHLIPVM